MIRPYISLLIFLFLLSCSSAEDKSRRQNRHQNLSWSPIERSNENFAHTLPAPVVGQNFSYPWEASSSGKHPRVTKNFFRCKGNPLNPSRTYYDQEGKAIALNDCAGAQEHSLPLVEGNEHIFPIQVDLLNWIQEKTGQRVVITCGHRCPVHNDYATTGEEKTSKHMIGAEVDFYVEGMEEQPLKIIELIQEFYAGSEELSQFQRYTTGPTNVSTAPWFNREVFIKLFQPLEGRDSDNRHPYPYICIQVRWDKQSSSKVHYTWKQAHQGYRRQM